VPRGSVFFCAVSVFFLSRLGAGIRATRRSRNSLGVNRSECVPSAQALLSLMRMDSGPSMMTRSSEMAGRATETFEISGVERAGLCLDQRQFGARRSPPAREGEYPHGNVAPIR